MLHGIKPKNIRRRRGTRQKILRPIRGIKPKNIRRRRGTRQKALRLIHGIGLKQNSIAPSYTIPKNMRVNPLIFFSTYLYFFGIFY